MGDRFFYIVHTIANKTQRKIDWFDYDNEGGEYNPGYFDTARYNVNVDITGKFDDLKKNRFENYDYSFPTEWFYKPFEHILDNEVANYIEKQKNIKESKRLKKQNYEEKLKNIKDDIISKLSTEELKYIKFINLDEMINFKEDSFDNVTKEMLVGHSIGKNRK